MPINYGSYQIDPFQGFSQGLANIGQALKYRREMERQKMLDVENKKLRGLQIEQAELGIERTKAENLGTIGAYSEEGKLTPTLGEAYAAQKKKEIKIKEAKERDERIDRYLKTRKDLEGTAEQKNKFMQDWIGNDPDPEIQRIKNLKFEGDKIKFSATYKENELPLPGGGFAPGGTYDIEGIEIDDPKNPGRKTVRITEAKKREEKIKEFAPQAQLLVHPKTGVRKWFDMNKKEDIEVAQKEGFIPYEKPEKPEKLTMTDVKSAYSMDIGNIKNQMMVEMTPDEQIDLSGQPAENIFALLMAGKVGKSLSPERKKYYLGKLQETENYYGDLTNQVLGRKGAKASPKGVEVTIPEATPSRILGGIEYKGSEARGEIVPPKVQEKEIIKKPIQDRIKELINLPDKEIMDILKNEYTKQELADFTKGKK